MPITYRPLYDDELITSKEGIPVMTRFNLMSNTEVSPVNEKVVKTTMYWLCDNMGKSVTHKPFFKSEKEVVSWYDNNQDLYKDYDSLFIHRQMHGEKETRPIYAVQLDGKPLSKIHRMVDDWFRCCLPSGDYTLFPLQVRGELFNRFLASDLPDYRYDNINQAFRTWGVTHPIIPSETEYARRGYVHDCIPTDFLKELNKLSDDWVINDSKHTPITYDMLKHDDAIDLPLLYNYEGIEDYHTDVPLFELEAGGVMYVYEESSYIIERLNEDIQDNYWEGELPSEGELEQRIEDHKNNVIESVYDYYFDDITFFDDEKYSELFGIDKVYFKSAQHPYYGITLELNPDCEHLIDNITLENLEV